MKAVVNAILMDSEARRGDDPAQVQASDGHLKEPVLLMMNLLRATNATSDGANLNNYASDMKEEPFESPTVFNFYPPDNGIPATTLLGPEFRIFNSTTAISRINFVNDLVFGSVGSTTKTDISTYVALAPNPTATGGLAQRRADARPAVGRGTDHHYHHRHQSHRQHQARRRRRCT